MRDEILTIPEEVENLVSSLETEKRQAEERKRRREEETREKYRRIDQLRDEREDELKEAAAFVFEWARAFAMSDTGLRIARLDGPRTRIPIFHAKFWLGEPQPETTVTVWASLQLCKGTSTHKDIALRYSEHHKGHEISHVDIPLAPKLWRVVHPDFLAQCAEHLKSDDAFKYILQELKRRQPPKP